MIHWADIIDGAQYPDAKTAVEMQEPATRLALVIEGAASPDLIPKLIGDLAHRPLSEVASESYVTVIFDERYERHRKAGEILKTRATMKDGVVFFDLSEDKLETYNKFIPYYLFPDSVYSVGLSASAERTKIAVGTNPWNRKPNTANLASICERYGGGGHAKVAAISLPPGEHEQARQLSQEDCRNPPEKERITLRTFCLSFRPVSTCEYRPANTAGGREIRIKILPEPWGGPFQVWRTRN